jgi:hypothetical protein
MAMGMWLLFQIAECTWGSERLNGEAVWLCPLAWYIFMQGVVMWVGTLVKWRGDDVAILLLKLMEERTASSGVNGNQ